MSELKRLSAEALPTALEKALRYRLLNKPAEAESSAAASPAAAPDKSAGRRPCLAQSRDQFQRSSWSTLHFRKTEHAAINR